MEVGTYYKKLVQSTILSLILSTEELATMTLSRAQGQSPGTKWYPGEKEAKMLHSACKAEVILISLLSPWQVWQEIGGGRTFQRPGEKSEHRSCQAWSNTRRAAGRGNSQAPQDLVRCCVCTFWSQNIAGCLSNSISIQDDKLSCSLTNSVHFLNNQCPGNNMRTHKYQPVDREGKSITAFAVRSPLPGRTAGGGGKGSRAQKRVGVSKI